MKPTQEQIEAALRYVKSRITDDTSIEVQTINALYPHVKDSPLKPIFLSANILADAYRELNKAIHATITENLHLADGDECTLKRLTDAIKYDNL